MTSEPGPNPARARLVADLERLHDLSARLTALCGQAPASPDPAAAWRQLGEVARESLDLVERLAASARGEAPLEPALRDYAAATCELEESLSQITAAEDSRALKEATEGATTRVQRWALAVEAVLTALLDRASSP